MRVLVTGGTGFVGGAFIARASQDSGISLRVAVRGDAKRQPGGMEIVAFSGLAASTDWRNLVNGCDAVVHAAARVHVMRDTAADPLAEFRRVNVDSTLQLARQAAEAGVRRFLFISSIKVNGEGTLPGRPYTADDPVAPTDPYGISKHEAEAGLWRISRETGMEVVVIRPVLVYGPGVRANFLSMVRWVHRGIPLPLGAVHNRRSFVAVDNLADLMLACLVRPAAANQTFLVSDGEDLSTTELLQRVAHAFGKRALLVPIPAGLLRGLAGVAGRGDAADRLFGNLQVDIEKTRRLLGWSPPVDVDTALSRTARHFLEPKRPGT